MLNIEAKTDTGTSKIVYNGFSKEVRIITTSFETIKHSVNAKLYPNILALENSNELKELEIKYSARLKEIEVKHQEQLKLLLKEVSEDLEKFDTNIESKSQLEVQ